MNKAMKMGIQWRPAILGAVAILGVSGIVLSGCGDNGPRPPTQMTEADQLKSIQNSSMTDAMKQMAIAQVKRQHGEAQPAPPAP